MSGQEPTPDGAEWGVACTPHFQHNFAALMVDYVFFSVAFSLVSLTVVMPAFVRTLTDSEPLVGLINTVFSAGWLLPQLGAAALMDGKAHKKPYMMAAVYIGRPLFLLLALLIWGGLTSNPPLMLTVFFASISSFTLLDGIASVAWFDILARAIPLQRRGRLIGTSQLLAGILGVGIGLLVGQILESPRLPYPSNYALLFALSALAHVPSMVALTVLREPQGCPGEPSRSMWDFLRQLRAVWRGEPNFRRLMGFRWLVGLWSLAISFYVLHATEVMGLSESTTGWFVSAQMGGGILASLVMGRLSERRGPLPVIRITGIAALLCPLMALLIHFAGGLRGAYPLVYILIGFSNNAWMLGPTNYVLEMAPEDRRALYVGLYNTLGGVLVPASFLGGVLLRATSYPVLFVTTAAAIAAGCWFGMGLQELEPKPRQ